MAQSPAHRWGQIIGNLLEDAIAPVLQEFAQVHGLYLDRKGVRQARPSKELIWVDTFGNRHKLDYVLERGGTTSHIGAPVAFVEIAWRRYTKHSKNKVQEIQSAIEPLLTKHREAAPFFGAILGGVFTAEALAQLRSHDCTVLYFPYQSVLDAFAQVSIDAATEEVTPDAVIADRVRVWEALPGSQKQDVARALLELNAGQVQAFMNQLRIAVERQIESIRVIALHGVMHDFGSIQAAISFIEGYNARPVALPFSKYELQVRFSDGSHIEATFMDQMSTIQFLHGYLPPLVRPATSDEAARDDLPDQGGDAS